jgi:hypothetical protein
MITSEDKRLVLFELSGLGKTLVAHAEEVVSLRERAEDEFKSLMEALIETEVLSTPERRFVLWTLHQDSEHFERLVRAGFRGIFERGENRDSTS